MSEYGSAGRKLDSEVIAGAAIVIADAEGLGAVSMRRVGAALGVTAMALYRHVVDRDALLVCMASRVAAEQPPARRTEAHWREALEHLAVATWDAFEAHPWLHSIVISPTRLLDLMTEKQTEAVLGSLVKAGLSPVAAQEALIGASAIAIGMAAISLPIAGPIVYARTTPGSGERDESATPLAEEFRDQAIDAARGRSTLSFTLKNFLDGVAASIESPSLLDPPASPEVDSH